jgi:DHA1 family bicyclomycin/chloramphenicol resistance-like MFS transporter
VALRAMGPVGLTTFLALSMALAALGIDLLLPAFGAVRADLGLAADSNATAGLITTYFLGLAVGQLAYGPLADRYGRRPTLYAGYAIYVVGAVASFLAPDLGWLLAARGLWGLGAAGPRVVTLAVIRDTWAGERMSRAMSFVMAVFILVPVLSPALGAGILLFAPWRTLFAVCALAAAGMAVWGMRLPETLDAADRMELSPERLVRAVRFVVGNRVTLGYTLALTSLYGVFTSWIASSEIIISEVFDRAAQFPVIFGALAGVLGLAMLLNARIVERVGTRRLAGRLMRSYVGVSGVLVVMALATGGRPTFWLFIVVMAAMLGSHALLIPNFNSLAMEAMGSVAGTASAVIGATQVAIGAALGAVLDRLFDGTITPLAVGFLFYGLVSLGLVSWAERGRAAAEAPEAVAAR